MNCGQKEKKCLHIYIDQSWTSYHYIKENPTTIDKIKIRSIGYIGYLVFK